MHHGSVMGLIGSELNWEAEALRVGHGGLLHTLVSLYNAYHKPGTEFRERINELAKEFERVWKEHVAARDKTTLSRPGSFLPTNRPEPTTN